MTTDTTPTTVSKPLFDFEKIGHNSFVFTPSLYTFKQPLVLIFSWNAGAAKHIAKYTVSYQKLFPTARIVLVRCNTPDMFRSGAQYRKLLSPALDLVKEHVAQRGEILVHHFSNGGGNQVIEFAKAYKASTGTVLPMRAQIIDSGPGKGEWMRSYAAIILSLPRTLLWRILGPIFVHLLLTTIFIFDKVTRRENKAIVMAKELNNAGLFDRRAPRVYLYSKADKMVGHDEVEEHADLAASHGWDVAKVKFEKSPHAGHVREDPDRYWGKVMEAWKLGPH
ncbi:DUF829-domain-containing protein [Amniculicola lignicola CBS 123094]|uniref:DUF829-domain-containing protein n=1 Tax=Amniculicola lignicola CBS 123094 TaxID=1392246 RepID=A0A6A5VZN4_9PLEO|nr:DUF829-domain-containing protein [Amniculicola lignicola CBS 123094]